jgi:hypothetical protein
MIAVLLWICEAEEYNNDWNIFSRIFLKNQFSIQEQGKEMCKFG